MRLLDVTGDEAPSVTVILADSYALETDGTPLALSLAPSGGEPLVLVEMVDGGIVAETRDDRVALPEFNSSGQELLAATGGNSPLVLATPGGSEFLTIDAGSGGAVVEHYLIPAGKITGLHSHSGGPVVVLSMGPAVDGISAEMTDDIEPGEASLQYLFRDEVWTWESGIKDDAPLVFEESLVLDLASSAHSKLVLVLNASDLMTGGRAYLQLVSVEEDVERSVNLQIDGDVTAGTAIADGPYHQDDALALLVTENRVRAVSRDGHVLWCFSPPGHRVSRSNAIEAVRLRTGLTVIGADRTAYFLDNDGMMEGTIVRESNIQALAALGGRGIFLMLTDRAFTLYDAGGHQLYQDSLRSSPGTWALVPGEDSTGDVSAFHLFIAIRGELLEYRIEIH